MNNFYQIVCKTDIDGAWVGFFVENSEIYNTYDEAYKEAEKLANSEVQRPFNTNLTIQYREKNDEKIIEVFNLRHKDVEKEYYIKKLTVK